MSKTVTIIDRLPNLAEPFNQKNSYKLDFERECEFAKNQLTKNDFTLNTARSNPESLKSAIMNVAAIGITLNPASAHAYLVPRDGAVCLDVSYKGLIKLATDSGAIKWAKAVLVYEGDDFTWHGVNQMPAHSADVFKKDRMCAKNPLNNLAGGYCLAELSGGGFMVDTMTADEILNVRDTSKAKRGPWAGVWAGEMAKKTLVKRAYKSWPQSADRDRLDSAVNVINEHEGLEQTASVEFLKHTNEDLERFQSLMELGSPCKFYLWWKGLDENLKTSLYNSFEKGQVTKGKRYVDGLESKGLTECQDIASEIDSAFEKDDEVLLLEAIEGLENHNVYAISEFCENESGMWAVAQYESNKV